MLKLTLFLVLIGVCACFALPKNLLEITQAQVVAPVNCTSIYSCVSDGDSCNGNFASGTCNFTTGNSATCCAAGLTCTNSKCATDNIGSSCSNRTQCYSSLVGMYDCIGGTCQYIYTIGDTCTNSSNCLSGLTCNNSTNTCQGLSYGQICSLANPQCNFGLYCGPVNITTYQCMNTTAQGSACNTTATANCAPGNDCINGMCAASGSGTQGQTCLSATACGDDLTCASNGTCVGATTSLSTCTENSDCNPGATCVCSSFSGKAYCLDPLYNPCSSEAASLSSCMATQSCTKIEGTPESCTYLNCYSSFKKANSCGCDGISTISDTCGYNPYCGGFPVWAIILIIVVAIVLVLAIVLLVFFMMRRRRQYDSI